MTKTTRDETPCPTCRGSKYVPAFDPACEPSEACPDCDPSIVEEFSRIIERTNSGHVDRALWARNKAIDAFRRAIVENIALQSRVRGYEAWFPSLAAAQEASVKVARLTRRLAERDRDYANLARAHDTVIEAVREANRHLDARVRPHKVPRETRQERDKAIETSGNKT